MRLPEHCFRGINSSSLGGSLEILDKASITDGRRDNYLSGSFCPPSPGFYRLIYKGDIDANFENQYSSYTFNNVSTKSRTTSYFKLTEKTCYTYEIKVSIMKVTKGELYYQKEGETEKILTKDESYSCYTFLCFSGSADPQCYIPKISCEHKSMTCRGFIQLLFIYVSIY